MAVASLLVVLEAQTARFEAAMQGASQQLARMDRPAQSARRGVLMLQQGIQSLAFHAAGIPGPVGKAVQALGLLGVGSTMMIGVMAGVAGFVLLNRKLTEGLREAEKQAEATAKTLASLLAQGRPGVGFAQQLFGFGDQRGIREQITETEQKIARLRTQRGTVVEQEIAKLQSHINGLKQVEFVVTQQLADVHQDLADKILAGERAQLELATRAVMLQLGLVEDIRKVWEDIAGMPVRMPALPRFAPREGLAGLRPTMADIPSAPLDLRQFAGLGTTAIGRQIAAQQLARVGAGLPTPKEMVQGDRFIQETVAVTQHAQEIWLDMWQGIGDAGSMFFVDFAHEGFTAFANLTTSIADLWLQMLGRMAMMKLFQELLPRIGLSPSETRAIVGSMREGGIVGAPSHFQAVNPAVFLGAPHFARGGVVGDEVPIIAHRGEVVIPRGAGAGGTAVHVTQQFYLTAMDARGLRELVLQNRGLFAGAVLEVARESRDFKSALVRG